MSGVLGVAYLLLCDGSATLRCCCLPSLHFSRLVSSSFAVTPHPPPAACECLASYLAVRLADRNSHRAPPGARYDPIGPGDGPPDANLRGGPRFPGGRGGMGGGMGMGMGGPPNPFGGFGGGDFI